MPFRSLLSIILAAALALISAAAAGHEGDENTTLALIEARLQFQADRFGMFVHWGLFSLPGEGETVMNDRRMPIAEYEKLAAQFNPAGVRPADWVALARSAGMRYLTFTAKHHDGFAMWDSKVSDWNVVKRTPFARDVVKELSGECLKQGMKLFLYYSQLDWHHPDYFPRGRTGRSSGRPESGNWTAYLDTMDAQLRELATGYGTIQGVWFDGWWDRPDADCRLASTYGLIRTHQPKAVIGTNRRRHPEPGEDFMIYERFLPGQDIAQAGFSGQSEIHNLPMETCDTINGSWGYRSADRSFKSARELIHMLVRAAGADANLLLGVGPDANGQIAPEVVQRLRETGMWLAKNGESIYGTRGGPLPLQPWGATTRRGKKVYVHVLDSATTSVTVPLPARRIGAVRNLADGEDVPFHDEGGSVTLTLGRERPGEMARVTVLQTE